MIADTNRVTIVTAFQAAEMQGRMVWVLKPQAVVSDGEFLNIGGKSTP